MASFDPIKQPNLSNGICAAEKRTKLSTQGTPQVCSCVQACTLPVAIHAGRLAAWAAGAYLREAQTQAAALESGTIAEGHLWTFSSFKVGSRGLMEHFLIFTYLFFILFHWPHAFH